MYLRRHHLPIRFRDGKAVIPLSKVDLIVSDDVVLVLLSCLVKSRNEVGWSEEHRRKVALALRAASNVLIPEVDRLAAKHVHVHMQASVACHLNNDERPAG